MSAKQAIENYGTLCVAIFLFVALLFAAENFASAANLTNILKNASFLAILSIGFTIALITAELDLSFANVCSFSAIVVGSLLATDFPWQIAAASGLIVGLLAGVANGVLVVVVKVPSLISTLATSSIANGMAFFITGGVAFVGRWDEDFLFLARGSLGPVPLIVLLSAIIFLVAWFHATSTRTGIHMRATGENEEAARLSGISTARMKFLGLSICGLLAGITGVLLVSNLSSAAPQMAGDYLLNAIAATLLGMTMFSPGKPNIPGSIVGVLTISVLSNGLVLLGAQYYVQDIMLGVIIIASVAFSASVLKRAAFTL